MLKAVFFFLFGTLLNTIPDIQACVNATLSKFGYPALDAEHTRRFIGHGARALIERILPENCPDTDACCEDYRARFAADRAEHTSLYPDEMGVLEALKARGLKLAVITNKPQDAADSVVSKFFPARFFDFVGGDTGMFPCKPDPSLTRYAALRLRVSPAECVFVGDGETDVQLARATGMRGVSVLWGYRPRDVLEQAGATCFAADFLHLQKILEKIS